MSTSDTISEPPQTSKPQLRARFKAYLKRRARQFSYLLLFLVLGLLFLAAVLEIYRGASLLGLRDIGDPFDVAAFRSFRVADDQDAIAVLRDINEKLKAAPMPSLPRAVRRLGPNVGWSKAAPEIRDWVTAHREVLAMFQAAAERPDGIPNPESYRDHSYYYLGELSWLVILEASRLQEQGDMAGAWSWYRVLFRMKNHVIRRGSIFQRFVVDRNCSSLAPAIATWAADRRTSASLLRRALDDVLAGEPRPEWDAFSLKVDYLEMMYRLDEPWGPVQQGDDEDQHVTIWGEDLPPNLAWMSYAAKRYIASEPERSRRVLRVAFANWLAHTEEKDPRLRKAVLRAKFAPGKRATSVPFYAVSPTAPAAARTLSPESLARWLVGTRDAKLLLGFWPWPGVRMSEERAHRALVVLLAGALYERDHGKPPPSDEALVGPYLDHLPSDGSEDLDDGSAPTITDDKTADSAKPGPR